MVVVGADWGERGAAYSFNGTTGAELHKLVPADCGSFDSFCVSVAVVMAWELQ